MYIYLWRVLVYGKVYPNVGFKLFNDKKNFAKLYNLQFCPHILETYYRYMCYIFLCFTYFYVCEEKINIIVFLSGYLISGHERPGPVDGFRGDMEHTRTDLFKKYERDIYESNIIII